VLPDPVLPDPVLPDPVLPDPVLPEPVLPDPVLPEVALPEAAGGTDTDPLAVTPPEGVQPTAPNPATSAPNATAILVPYRMETPIKFANVQSSFPATVSVINRQRLMKRRRPRRGCRELDTNG
jgi:hypothetical protein